MIVGLIEIVTQRRAGGWAEDTQDPLVPLVVRARDGVSIVAQTATQPTATLGRDGRSHAFEIEFPASFNPDRLVIEACREDGGDWIVLPRHAKIWGSYLHGEPSLLSGTEPADAIAAPATTAFWDSNRRTGTDRPARPVFVLGSVRSGTTAICQALQSATRYQGFSEGHILDVAIRLINAANAHFEKKDPYIASAERAAYHLGQISPTRLHAEIVELLRRLADGYQTPYFFDKTPTYQMIASVPILAEAWPAARFIFMKRRGLENMASRLRKFGTAEFAGNCRDWALIMSAWRSVRNTVNGRFIEIDQRTMADQPDSVAEDLGVLLDLSPHEVLDMVHALRHQRPETTDPCSSVIGDIAELGWTDQQIEIFRATCGAEMDACGYTYDARYYAAG